MNDFLFKFFQGLFDETKPEEIPRIVNQLTFTGLSNFRLPQVTTTPEWNPPETGTCFYLASTANEDETSSSIALRGIFDKKHQAFWISKGDTLVKITGTPFLLSKRYARKIRHVREQSGTEAEQRAKLFQMHMNKIANYLDLANVTGLYTEINAPESNAEFLKQYTAIPYQ